MSPSPLLSAPRMIRVSTDPQTWGEMVQHQVISAGGWGVCVKAQRGDVTDPQSCSQPVEEPGSLPGLPDATVCGSIKVT